MTTKEQERKALDQIKKILKDFEPDSYIMTAFRGCIEDAESNIENDFANSQYERAERYLKERDELKATAEENAKACEIMKARILPGEDLRILYRITGTVGAEIAGKATTAADRIVMLAAEGKTDTADFRTAVSEYKRADRDMDEIHTIRGHLSKIIAGA